ncbi:hypothetical protein SteCoe_30744 [Stentor coeruleus]|uniref:Uncharacterized protein n=1 Tax=Stentor coeruleus TaxID=5963 RepID=A0A1R2B2V8_9CILI|nr:hypothetical protein SteCoe_30744 [Stentor coeruleus]
MAAQKNKQGLIVNVEYAKEEVRRPIITQVIVEKIENLPGSTTGAGSGDFHQYRNLKRREEARLEMMEIEYRERKIREEFERLREFNKQKCTEKTAKKALKRKKKKEYKKMKKLQITDEKSEKTIDECVKKQKIEENSV